MAFWDLWLIAIVGVWLLIIFKTHRNRSIFSMSRIKFGLLIGLLAITAVIHTRLKGYYELFTFALPFVWNQVEKNMDEKGGFYHAHPLDSRKVVAAIVRVSEYGDEIVEALNRAQSKMPSLRIEICQMEKCEDMDEQILLVHDIINKRPDAILLMPIKSDPRLIDVLVKAQEKMKILIVTLDRQLAKEEFYRKKATPPLHFSSDFYIGGQKAAETMIEFLGKGGNIAYIDGEEDTEVASIRRHAIIDVILKHSPKFRIVYYESTNWSKDDGKRVMKKFLQGTIRVDGAFCSNDTLALGALEAIEEIPGAEGIVIIGYDGIQSAVDKVTNGKLAATVNVKHEQQVNQALQTIEGILYNREIRVEAPDLPIPPTILVNHNFIPKKMKKIKSLSREPEKCDPEESKIYRSRRDQVESTRGSDL